MDNIDRIMKEADRLGFGVSYGKYRAACLNDSLEQAPAPQKPESKETPAKICRYCQKPFVPRHANQAYCTPECQYKIKILRQNAWRKNEKKRPPLIVSCVICGADFKAKCCTSRYCGPECAQEGGRINAKRWRSEHRGGDL